MTLDEAIKHAEEVAEKFESLHERYENMYEDRLLFRVEENECKNCAKEHRQLANWLKELKQLREQTEWIPCDIRLPKQNEYIGNVCKYYLVQDKYDDMYVARYTKRGWNPIDTLFFLGDVVAWRQLPERYEYEGDNNDK